MAGKHLNRRFYRKVVSIALCVTMLSGTFFYHGMDVDAKTDLTLDDYREEASTYSVTGDVPGYTEYLNVHEQVFPEDVIEIDAADFCHYEDRDGVAEPDVYTNYEGMEGDSVLTTESALIEFDFEVATSGYYDLSLLYYPVEGKSSEIQRSFFIDGALPYGELSLIEFSRVWTTSVYDYYINADDIEVARWPKDNQGNDLKPTAIEVPEWIESYLFDSNGYITDELKVYLEAGSHTLSIMSLREPMLIRKIIFSNSEDPEPYAVVKANWDAMGAVQTTGQNIRIEAENAVKTSSQMLYPKQDQSSPAVYPSSAKELLNNSIGGTNWQNAGQWVEWEFEVPETGYYNISMYDKQNFVRGIYVSRKIMIDGEIPFAEMSDYGFDYAQNWRLDVLSDDEGTPYQFYLEKGTHTIRMEVVLGDFSEIISTVQDSVQDLNAIYRQIIRITGVSPDKYRDYQIASSLPELQGELEEVRAKLDSAIVELQAIAGSNTDKTTVLITMRDQLDELIYDQERFTEVINSYKINVRACGNWITQVVTQPLQIDRIYVYSDSSEPKVTGASWFSRLVYELKRLFYSFIIDYNQIGNIADSNTEGTTITLWVGTGRDQANVIKNLIDESFTSTTNINVNVQLVDMSTLLKASLAGEGPDVAIQVGPTQVATAQGNATMVSASNDTPVNYGIRNAVLDLRQFEDYDEVVSRFSDSALVPFTYNGATYALPDTQTFLMMFYRKDILQEIGLEVPRTWDEVKVAMTVLSKNQMEFGMLPGEQVFAMFLFQNGGTYYSHEGMASALDEDVAVNTFKEYCEYYTDYKLDKETSVEERFRTGECPIIIADYTVFNNLAVSAPDIEGLWDFTVVPGIMQEDGTINHTTGSIGVADMIMADTEYPEESWEFLKWWTSAETQTLYGREMESLMGAAGRVATANVEALGNLSWQVDAYEALMEQFEQVQGIPQVPGGYYTWRNVNNAFYSVTTDTNTATPRESLMEKVEYINAEIDYKREELGLPILED
ncbi:MAG: extracellular solute-binding protein [Lachnospiraceae bacterium]|nr:extracellular solute-binding protein [Lachnospiraceae bacterium]